MVAVRPVRNETFLQLDQVALGGLLERALSGPDVYDVPKLLGAGFTKALEDKGYRAVQLELKDLDFTQPLAGDARPPFDAVLLSTVESWSAASTSSATPGIDMRVRVEVRRVPEGEILYEATSSSALREDPRSRSANEVPSFIMRSAQKALGSLPGARP